MTRTTMQRGRVSLLLFAMLSVAPLETAAVDNMRFHGALVAEPCVIPPGEESVKLDFGTVIDKYLYLNQRTHGQSFELNLAECDLSIGKTVSVTFRGAESLALPGLLAPSVGGASGIAIGLETEQGQALPLNQPSGKYQLSGGNTVLQLRAYVQGEPDALANRSLGLGVFRATATFQLEYE
ncbi:fimbrial protein [Serratia nevei]|uniref:fimbrial protein n=1 Tax=Serratia nevei TaxID=2703794 RepID=UPI003FA74E39